MSNWTYINGTITVEPLGITQAELRYVLETVLNHLPIVEGSERDMSVYIVQKNGYNHSSSIDEFGFSTNNLTDSYGDKSRRGSRKMQREYILVVNGALRDAYFEDTLKQFNKWLCRLAKRVHVQDVLVSIKDYGHSTVLKDDSRSYYNMFEYPSWSGMDTFNWCEIFMRGIEHGTYV